MYLKVAVIEECVSTPHDEHDLFSTHHSEGGASELSVPSDLRPGGETLWSIALTQRQRVLLHVLPLEDMKLADSLRDHGAHYDTLALVLKTFDVIIDHTGFGTQVNRDLLYQRLTPLLAAMDFAAGHPGNNVAHGQAVDRVISALRNDSNGRRPFAVEYQDFSGDGHAIRRILEFRLLTEEYGLDGSIVLVLTPEAINLYLRAFDLDIEDAQIANEAVVQSQINRGKFNEAIQSAQNARLQSIRFHDGITRLLRQTRRDVDKVDWRKEVPELLRSALQHVEGRLDAERIILQTAENRREELPSGSGHVQSLLEVARLMRDCQQRHLELHRQLMRARGDFLEQQSRQSFSLQRSTRPVDLMEAALAPALALTSQQGGPLADAILPTLCGAQPRPVLSVKDLVEWHLRPRRPLPPQEVPIEPTDVSDGFFEVPRFSTDCQSHVDRLLAGLSGEVRLSMILQQLQDADASSDVQELLVLRVLRNFAPEDGHEQVTVTVDTPPTPLQVNGFYGDDLLVQPGGSHAR